MQNPQSNMSFFRCAVSSVPTGVGAGDLVDGRAGDSGTRA